jgi:hypothetical protein
MLINVILLDLWEKRVEVHLNYLNYTEKLILLAQL